jgi:hypothetical protein
MLGSTEGRPNTTWGLGSDAGRLPGPSFNGDALGLGLGIPEGIRHTGARARSRAPLPPRCMGPNNLRGGGAWAWGQNRDWFNARQCLDWNCGEFFDSKSGYDFDRYGV